MKMLYSLFLIVLLAEACSSEVQEDVETNFPHRDTSVADGKPPFMSPPPLQENDSIRGWAVETDFEMNDLGKHINGITFLKLIDSTVLKVEMNALGEIEHIFALEKLPSGDALGHELENWDAVKAFGVIESDSSMIKRFHSIVDNE